MAPQSTLQRSGAHISGQTGGGSAGSRTPQDANGRADQDELQLGSRSGPQTPLVMSNAHGRDPKAIMQARVRRQAATPEGIPKAVWSDSVAHLGDEPWPAHSVPLFCFNTTDRPCPAYREEIDFIVIEDRFINFTLRLRCGTGDRYMGGSVGLVQLSPDRGEAVAGDRGQLVTITEITVQPDNSVLVSAIGDLDFTIKRAWCPRGLQGLQLAFVDVAKVCVQLDTLPMTCASEPNLTLFAHLLDQVPNLRQLLHGPGPFTAFVPTNEALDYYAEEMRGQDLEGLLKAHICEGHVACEAMYSGRALTALDGTTIILTFTQWPRGNPCINDMKIEHMDIFTSNGVIHTLLGLIQPKPSHGQRRPRLA